MIGFVLFVFWVIVVVLIVCLVSWFIMSHCNHTWVLLKPNRPYMVQGRKYIFPNLHCTGPTYLLRDSRIAEVRHLLLSTSQILERCNIDWWLMGPSLLGAIRHQSIPLPYDDSLCIGIHDKHRDYLFSGEFVQKAHDLQVLYFLGASSRRAKHSFSARIRLQLIDRYACLYIYFYLTGVDKVYKLNGWKDGINIPNPQEQFEIADMFPLKKHVFVDNMYVNLPNNPQKVLQQQYAKDVLEKITTQSTERFSFPLFMWTQIPPG